MTRTFLRSPGRFRKRLRIGFGLVAGWVLAPPSGSAHAETLSLGLRSATEGEHTPRSFASSFGMERERRALELGGQARLRALKRLLPLSRELPHQVANLLDAWLSTDPKLSPLETWMVLRPMAALGSEPRVHQYLAKALAAEALVVEAKSPYAPLVAEVAALALAKHRTPESATLLAEWLRRPSERAGIVQRALLAHPPRDISPLIEASGPPTPLLLETLGKLGDPTAIPYLRQVVKRATADVQAAAAMALAELGVSETQDLATLWLERGDSPPALVQASAFILLRFGHPGRVAAFGRLAGANATLALQLAERMPADGAFLLLANHLDELANEQAQQRAVRILGTLGDRAIAGLVSLLKDDAGLRWEAARALSEGSTLQAVAALRPLLRVPEVRAAALSALIVLSVRHPDQSVPALAAELTRSSESSTPLERSLGKTGLALLDVGRARSYLASSHLDELAAASLAAAVHGPAYLRAGLMELERRAHAALVAGSRLPPPVLALSSLLSFVSPREVVSSRLLRALANSGYPIAETARWHEWARGGVEPGSRFTPAPPPSLHVQLAAAHSRVHLESNEAAFTLRDALAMEPDAELRAAMIQALRWRSNLRSNSETLDWLANYDPSPLVRKSAAAKVTDESVLRSVWIAAPPSPDTSAGYWVTVQAADRAPMALYLAAGPNAFVLIRGPAQATVVDEASPPSADERALDAPTRTNEFGVIPLHAKALLHPIHPLP